MAGLIERHCREGRYRPDVPVGGSHETTITFLFL